MTDSKEKNTVLDHAIAIVGMYVRVPGADGLDAFWKNLKNGTESITFFSDEDLQNSGVDVNTLKHPDYVKASGRLDYIDLFDADFFDMTPREAEVLDPQHRILLEGVWRSLEHAGVDPARYPGRIGLFAGVGFNRYLINNILSNPHVVEQSGAWQLSISNDKDFAPTRVAYKLNLQGPAIAINTACSTSLVATAIAASSLLNFQSDTAIAGGCSLNLPQDEGYIHTPGGTLSKDGHCRPFDKKGSGTIDGNGTACVVMKRYEDAISDGDTVYAVIRGFGINNDGSVKVGYTAPGVDGQADVIMEAMEMAQVSPDEVDFIETHGTATELGDTVEIAALKQVFGTDNDREHPCYLGAVKSNIGHLDTAAGASGLIKAVLSLSHKTIPPTCNFSEANPLLDLEKSPFKVNNSALNWENDGKKPRIAGVSSFGIGGTNAHVVLQEAPERIADATIEPRLHVFPISAKSMAALSAYTANLATFIHENPSVRLADVAFTLQNGRSDFEYKVAVTGSENDRLSLVSTLNDLSSKTAILAAEKGSNKASDLKSLSDKFINSPGTDPMSGLLTDWFSGQEVDWKSILASGKKVAIPGHPFIKSRFWLDPKPSLPTSVQPMVESGADVLKNPDPSDWFYLPGWKNEIPVRNSENLASNWLVLHDGSKKSAELIVKLIQNNAKVHYVDVDLFASNRAKSKPTLVSSDGAQILELASDSSGSIDWVSFFSANPTVKPSRILITGFNEGNSTKDHSYLDTFDHCVNLCFGLQKSFFSEEIDICVVGTHLLEANPQQHDVQLHEVSKSVILGPLKVLPQECPNFSTRFIDSGKFFDTEALISTVSQTQAGSLVKLRGGLAQYQTFEQLSKPLPQGSETRLRKRGTYLITGGLGDIGLTLAQHLCEQVEATVYVTTRNDFPDPKTWDKPGTQSESTLRRIHVLKQLKAKGFNVHIAKADVSDSDVMTDLINQIEKQHGRLDGVIHAAGIVGEASFNTISDSISEGGVKKNHTQFYPKTHGLEVLAHALDDRDFDFCLVCSSLSPILGGLGFAAYAATNAWADQAIELLNYRQSGRWITVNWEGWMFDHDAVPGGNAGASAAELGINAAEGIRVFEMLMNLSPVNRVVISSGNLNSRIQKWITKSQNNETETSGATKHPRPDYIGAYTAPSTPTQKKLTELWEQLLGINGIGIHDSFFELGGNSLLLTQLVSLIRKHFKSELTLARLFEQPTIDEMAGDIDAASSVDDLEEGVI
jgi:polyketide synthase PksJ